MCRASACQRCGESFVCRSQRGRTPKWCLMCKPEARRNQQKTQRRQASKQGHSRICHQCGKCWTAKDRRARFCSTRCQYLASGSRVILACKACGTSFECKAMEMRQGRQFCSMACMLNLRRKPPRTCLGCGISFFAKVNTDPRKGKGEYCSKKCAGAARRDGRRVGRWQEARELRQCRAAVKPSQKMYAAIQKAMARQWASVASLWRKMNTWRPCRHCDGPLPEHACDSTSFCSILCSSKYEHQVECGKCGKSFLRKGMQGRRRPFCHTCKRKRLNKQKRAYGKGIRQRAKRFGVERVPYSRDEVFSRDRWQCQLCWRSLLRRWTYNKTSLVPHLRNATIDHIMPMSKGGADAEWNVQACCLECNGKKSANAKGQLRLRIG